MFYRSLSRNLKNQKSNFEIIENSIKADLIEQAVGDKADIGDDNGDGCWR